MGPRKGASAMKGVRMYVWNMLGRHTGGRNYGPKVNASEEPSACPRCGRVGRYHIVTVPKMDFCAHLDCGWRSCSEDKITWSVRTGVVTPLMLPRLKA